MLKFIRTTCIIFIIFLTGVFFLELIFSNYQNFIRTRFKDYYKNTSTSELLLLGNSHMQALGSPEINAMQSFNFSFGGQDIYHCYAIVKTVLKQENNLKYIIIGIDYDLLGYDYEVANTQWMDRLYYENTGMMYDESISNYLMANSNFFKANRKLSNVLFKTGQKKVQTQFENFAVKIDCEKRAIEHSVRKYDKKLVSKNKNYIVKIIELCEQNDIKLIIINPPKASCYYAYYAKSVIQVGKAILTEVSDRKDIYFLDYWLHESFKDTMFLDNDHLNKEGVDCLLGLLKAKILSIKD